ncbi:MAG: hypothetical protein BGP01_01545 [Paludibacter sp. 47-17]|nr:MAG: hypothetical protein BGP01_01545 [Paludibacter sp. 47-17]
MIFIQVPALAIVLFIVLRSVQHLYLKVVVSQRYRRLFARWFPLLEIGLWVVYAFWSVVGLSSEMQLNFITEVFVVVVLAVSGWYFLRDFFAGFMLRSENAFEPGRRLKVGDSEGVISHIGYRSLQLTTDEGVLVKLPYSMLSGRLLMQPADMGRLNRQPVVLGFSSRLPADEVKLRLFRRLLEMPWVLPSFTPEIKLRLQSDGVYRAEIQLRVVDEESLMKTQSELLEFAVKEL